MSSLPPSMLPIGSTDFYTPAYWRPAWTIEDDINSLADRFQQVKIHVDTVAERLEKERLHQERARILAQEDAELDAVIAESCQATARNAMTIECPSYPEMNRREWKRQCEYDARTQQIEQEILYAQRMASRMPSPPVEASLATRLAMRGMVSTVAPPKTLSLVERLAQKRK